MKEEINPTVRIAEALERIADLLNKMYNPPVYIRENDRITHTF
jgi:hypothetical protein